MCSDAIQIACHLLGWVFVKKKKLEKGWNQEPAAGENF